jgi:hypothetical protein
VERTEKEKLVTSSEPKAIPNHLQRLIPKAINSIKPAKVVSSLLLMTLTI